MRLVAVVVCTSVLGRSPAVWSAATFQGLGDLSGGSFSSGANGVSADGSVVVGVGNSANSPAEAFRWTASGGMVGLGDLPGGSFSSIAHAVSANGSVVVGASSSGNAGGFDEAFRWTASTGMVGLGDFDGGQFRSIANDVSANGSVVVGQGRTGSSTAAFRWTQSEGLVALGELPGGFLGGSANGISADGSVITGLGRSTDGDEGFRWTQSTGSVGIGDLPGGFFDAEATAISADGAVIVGTSDSGPGFEAFRWTSAGMVGLGDLPGGMFSAQAQSVSADGSVIVGRGSIAGGELRAFVWTAAGGLQDLRDVLIAGGATGLTGWTLTNALDISDDGRTIVGDGFGPSGREAWIARLSPSSPGGDFDADGDADGADFIKWQRGESPSPRSATDLAAWKADFGPPASGNVENVPEPGSIALLLIATLACRARHFQQR